MLRVNCLNLFFHNSRLPSRAESEQLLSAKFCSLLYYVHRLVFGSTHGVKLFIELHSVYTADGPQAITINGSLLELCSSNLAFRVLVNYFF